MEVDQSQKIPNEIVGENIRLIFSPLEDFHKVRLTVVHNIIYRICASTATTLMMLNKAFTDWCNACIVEKNEIESWLDHCNIYHTGDSLNQKIQAERFDKKYSLVFSPREDLHIVKHPPVLYIIWYWSVQNVLVGLYARLRVYATVLSISGTVTHMRCNFFLGRTACRIYYSTFFFSWAEIVLSAPRTRFSMVVRIGRFFRTSFWAHPLDVSLSLPVEISYLCIYLWFYNTSLDILK